MRIILRPIELKDGILIVKWRNNPSVLSHCMNKNPISIESNKKFFHEFVETGRYKQFIVEKIYEDFGVLAYPIATVYLKDMDYSNQKCELCVFTSSDEDWNDESQSLAVKMLIDLAFEEYNIHKIYSYVYKKFNNEIELLKRAGFKEETVLVKEAKNIEGEFEDIIRMCIFKK